MPSPSASPSRQPPQSPSQPPTDQPFQPSSPAPPNDNSNNSTASPIPDEADTDAEMPLTIAASVVLTALPQDARSALEMAARDDGVKVTIRLHPIASAPPLDQRRFKLSSSQPFATVVRFLRRRLRLRDSESLFCYVNSVFAPGLDESVGNLWKCFKIKDELVVAYSVTAAFG